MTAAVPRVALGIPAYKAGKWISKCLDSILGQLRDLRRRFFLFRLQSEDAIDPLPPLQPGPRPAWRHPGVELTVALPNLFEEVAKRR